MQKVIWLSYDLGLRGDYEGLYAWLDQHKAKECGDSLAFISYEYEGDLIEHIEKSLRGSVRLEPKDRIYLIYEAEEGKQKGRFLFGKRKQAPWAGYAVGSTETVDE